MSAEAPLPRPGPEGNAPPPASGLPDAVLGARLAAAWFAGSLAPVARGLPRHWRETARAVAGHLLAGPTASAEPPSGGPAGPSARASHGDRRFRDDAWESHRYFRLLLRAHVTRERLLHGLVDAAGLSAAERRRAHLAVELLSDALAPANGLLTNPEALRALVRSRGASVLRGARNAAEDLLGNCGRPRQVEPARFTVGRDLAITPGRVVLRTPLLELIQYEPQTPTVHAVPLLVSPPWINKYYALDLAPGRSLFEWAIRHGHTVFTISYRNIDDDFHDVSLEDYLFRGLVTACDAVRDITGSGRLNLLAACNGGTLAVMLLAWLAAGGERRVRSATLLNTSLSFSEGGLLDALRDGRTLAHAERLMARRGYLDGQHLAMLFDLLRGKDLFWHYLTRGWLLGESPPPFDILAWNNDVMNVAAATQRDFLHAFCLEDRLVNGSMTAAGRPLRLDRVREDVFMVAARNDHIVPWETAYRGARHLGGGVRFVLTSGGHVAGLVNPPRAGVRHWTADALADEPGAWLAGAEAHPGSWWQPWVAWLTERAGERQAPPPMGSRAYPATDPAPGTYVRR